ncbi:hypothetical protein GCM10027290_28230 [Micromonospora sonneratiae]|uniref:Excreted virulence factor EspC, type VII ESX diderm n=1 Tax=Micromonospora sonneratiae TaxID=1184706 RepID=A0ABW3Y7E2_9ACTN
MPPDDKGNKDEVAVVPEELIKTAGVFEERARFLNTLLPKLRANNVLPGDFPAATELSTNIGARKTELITAITNLSNVCNDIGYNLRKVAADYQAAEDDNVGDADRLNGLIQDVNKYFPGADATKPTKIPPATPYPVPEPAPN